MAQLRLKAGRFENLNRGERVCFYCNETVNEEFHIRLQCQLCQGFRKRLDEGLFNFESKFIFSYIDVVRFCVKTCYIFKKNVKVCIL